MKKEIAALLALVILLAASFYNIYYMDTLSDTLISYLDSSEKQVRQGDFGAAKVELRRAIDLWNRSDGYTHIFIRHPEIDSATDALYELLSDVCAQDSLACGGSYEKAVAHFRSIAGMEHITLGSVL